MELDKYTWELFKRASPRHAADGITSTRLPGTHAPEGLFLVSAHPYGWDGHVRGLIATREHHGAAQALVRQLVKLESDELVIVLEASSLRSLPRHWARFPVGASASTQATAVRLTLDGLPPRIALQAALALG